MKRSTARPPEGTVTVSLAGDNVTRESSTLRTTWKACPCMWNTCPSALSRPIKKQGKILYKHQMN